MDVFSFGCVIYELLSHQVTSAVVSQSGDANMAEMYAHKVRLHGMASLFAAYTAACSMQHKSALMICIGKSQQPVVKHVACARATWQVC